MTTLDLVAGCLIVGFVVILLIYFLLKLKKKEPFSPAEKQMRFFIMGALLIYVVLLAIRYSTGISNTDRLQILLQLGLVTITAVYAWSARQQSEANAKMAEEMRNQTLVASRPYIIQKAVFEKEIVSYDKLKNKLVISSPPFKHFEIYNAGNGPAIELEASILDEEKNAESSTLITYLSSKERIELSLSQIIDHIENPIRHYLVSEYTNVIVKTGEPTWYQTWMPFDISKSSEKGLLLTFGKLEFKEVTEKDRLNALSNLRKQLKETENKSGEKKP